MGSGKPEQRRNMNKRAGWRLQPSLMVIIALAASGCAWEPETLPADEPVRVTPSPRMTDAPTGPRLAKPITRGEHAALTATRMIGTPYRYGGDDLDGFDCSGLVRFAYRQAGLELPRTAATQRQAVAAVPRDSLMRGDLVFFNLTGKTDHVGIYVGDGRFVHAPSSGKRVQEARMDQGYFARHFDMAGRVRGGTLTLAQRQPVR